MAKQFEPGDTVIRCWRTLDQMLPPTGTVVKRWNIGVEVEWHDKSGMTIADHRVLRNLSAEGREAGPKKAHTA